MPLRLLFLWVFGGLPKPYLFQSRLYYYCTIPSAWGASYGCYHGALCQPVNIFIFGGFILAIAMEKWDLHRKWLINCIRVGVALSL